MITQGGGDESAVSLSGNLEDVPLADVLQFIHLGRRTGTLSLTCDGIEAEIGFHNGQIVGARSPASKPLGERLVQHGVIDREILEEGLEAQQSCEPRQSLGSILVTRGVVDGDTIRRAIEAHIAETVYELVTWTRGVFQFILDELRAADDIGMYPGDLIPHIDLNTQMVLLEATRIFDERNRLGEVAVLTPSLVPSQEPDSTPSEGPVDKEAAESEEETLASLLEGLGGLERVNSSGEESGAPVATSPVAIRSRLQVLTSDTVFYDHLCRHLEGSPLVRPVRIRPHEAGIGLLGEPPPIVLFDLRHGSVGPQEIRALRRSRPRAPIIAMVDESVIPSRVFEAGALAALPADLNAVSSCVESIIRNRLDLPTSDRTARGAGKSGLQRLRRILTDLRSGLLSATVALNLLHIISESVERAILFLVKGEGLSALGAFGFSEQGEPLAQATRSFHLPLSGEHPLSASLEDGQVRTVAFDEAGFPPEFVRLVGRPKTGQVVIFPVLGAQRVISVIYADNGETNRVIEDIELLELATAQVGMAFENELLRRQAGKSAPS